MKQVVDTTTGEVSFADLTAGDIASVSELKAAATRHGVTVADLRSRRAMLAAKSIAEIEASSAAIDARADFYAGAADATTQTAVAYVNTYKDDLEGLARRVADLQQTVAHLIRLTVLDH